MAYSAILAFLCDKSPSIRSLAKVLKQQAVLTLGDAVISVLQFSFYFGFRRCKSSHENGLKDNRMGSLISSHIPLSTFTSEKNSFAVDIEGG